MELGSPINNLDNHQCPKCNWSFINRIPRTLDCRHAFYFCENCLQSRQNVECGICRGITIIKQVLAPRTISNKSSLASSFLSDDYNNNDKNESISQFATIPTQILSKQNSPKYKPFHKLFTSPLKHYKHHNKYGSSSEPLKNSDTHNNKMQFEYDQIINLQKEIISLKNELEPELSDKAPIENNDKHIGNEINFVKQQVVELLIEKEKLIKKCGDMNQEITKLNEENIKLTQQNTQQKQDITELQNKYKILQSQHKTISKHNINKLKLECHSLSTDVKNYKNCILENICKSFKQILNYEMNEIINRSKQLFVEYNKEVLLRRKYFNQVQDLKGNIRVFCRIRPLLNNEIKNNLKTSVCSMDDFSVYIEKNKENDTKGKDYKKKFEFDSVFSIKSTQDEVFSDVKELITSILDGYNVCIFAYGATGSGKTYTMEGINYRAVNLLFNAIKQRELNYKYTMKLNMVEIYNEKIKDLLAMSSKFNYKNELEKDLKLRTLPTYLKIRGNNKTGLHINNLSELDCQNVNDVYNALDIGHKNRAFGITDMNQHSSRSHCILTINVKGIHLKSKNKYSSKLNLIDLAGCERVKLSNAKGDRMKEAQCINKSLSCLGNVLESIKLKKQYIPYRDSKLTYLLKDSIGNSAKTLMFVNVSSCEKDVDQTLTSLLFANRIRNVCLGKSIKNQSKHF